MKDFLDKELNVGDSIVGAVPHGRNSGASLSKGIIIGFTEKFVKAEIKTYNGYLEKRNIDPSKVIKL